jgi:hypothetical protein
VIERNTIHEADLFDLCAQLDAGSVVEHVPYACYNNGMQAVKMGYILMDENEVVRLYVEQGYTLRMIADELGTNHHMVRRVLTRHGVTITQQGRKRKPFTNEHRRKISEASKGRPSWSAGKVLPESFRRANMRGKLGTSIDLSKYADYARLSFLTRFLSKRREFIGFNDSVREPFLDKFYFDEQFNRIYDAWIASGQSKWWRPTLDHKHSQSNGGNWELENLQFLTWFENRAKAEMNDDEWLSFCVATNTQSDLFIRAGA